MGARVGLPLSLAAAQPGYANLSWLSATGKYFSVEYSTNLVGGFTGWQSNILATPPTNVVTVPTTDNHSYYRLKF